MGQCNTKSGKPSSNNNDPPRGTTTKRGTIVLASGVGGAASGNLHKILLVGDTGAGKTSLVLRFADNTFEETHISTIGVDFKQKTIQLEGKSHRLQIWDTAGQERYRTITHSYYRGVKGILVVYDVCERKSFTQISKWVSEIKNHAGDQVSIIIVGNKIDLPNRNVSTQEGKDLAKEYNALFVETSAKKNIGVEDAFIKLMEQVVRQTDFSDS